MLRDILAADFEIVDTVGDGRSLVEAARNLEPDMIIADVSMPLLNGFEATRKVREAGVRSKIIFLTAHTDVPLVIEAFRAGASGYLLKESVAKELVTAIREVMNGSYYVSPLITDDPASLFREAMQT